ncbi:MAG TPA: ATP-binding protein [Marmoricola sp.]|nr:ATP-binding protein [Marmoricola sp.]
MTGTTPRREVLRLLGFMVVFLIAGYVGRATVIQGHGISLIWPAIGVATVWIGTSNRRSLPADVAALSASTLLVNLTTGATLGVAALFLLINLVQVFVAVALVRRMIGGLWGFGGDAPLQRLADLGRLTVAAGVSGIAGLAVGLPCVTVVTGMPDPATAAVWWGRNSVAMVVIATLAMLLLQPLVGSGSLRGAAARVCAAVTPASRSRLLEVAALIGVTVALCLLVFCDTDTQPLAFLLLVTSVWAGLRFTAVAVTLHGVVMGAFGVAFTLSGKGPFAAIDDAHYRALAAQGFVAMTVLTGLALAFSQAERDVANRGLVQARQAADARARLLDAVLESLKEGVVVVDDTGRILVRNTAARSIVGIAEGLPDEVQPATTYGLFQPNGLPLTDEELPGSRALRGEVVAPMDLHVRSEALPGGRIVEMSAVPLVNDDPFAPGQAMVNIRDVTVDRQHRDTLASFAGVVAHDLFNPLTVVDGWTEALAEEFSRGSVSPAVGGLVVGRIHDAATHMRQFIADLMSYTIARDQTLRPGPVDVSELVRALAGLRALTPSAPVIVVADGLRVWADTGLVRQLLDNLIGNAVKYVEPGVRPTVEISGEAYDDWLELRISDNGIGIPENQREAVFETFHRAHGDGFGGTGLGLAICRRIVDRHGGTIHAAPGPRGQGSTFVLRLPRLAAATKTGAEQAATAIETATP